MEGEAVEACAERLVILQRRRDEGRERHVLAAPLRTGRGRPTRCGRRSQGRKPVHLALVRGFSVEGCEQASTAQVLDDAADGVLEHVAHLARRQARQLREGHAVRAQLAIAAVQEEHMQMWMELQGGARPLHDDHGPALRATRSRSSLLRHALRVLRVKAQHRAHEDARHGSQQRAVVREPLAPRERNRQDPLPQGRRGEHALHEVGRRRGHSTAEA